MAETTVGALCYMAYCFPHGLSSEALAISEFSGTSDWSHWFSRLDSEQMSVVEDHTFSFLPHVRRLLYPEFGDHRVSSGAAEATAGSCNVDAVRRYITPDPEGRAQRYGNAVARLTWDGAVLPRGSTLMVGNQGAGITLSVRWIDAVLFPDGTGILLIALRFPGDMSTVAAAQLARSLKKIEYRRRLTVEMPEMTSGGEGDDNTSESTTWRAVVESLLESIPSARGRATKITQQELSGSLGANWRLAIVGSVNDLGSDEVVRPFRTVTELGAFALATGRLPADGSADIPAAALCERLRDRHMVELWQDWSMLYHYDNLVQAIHSGDACYLEQQVENFEYEYLTLFILAMAQRFALDVLEGDLALISGELDSAVEEMSDFNERLISFMTRLRNNDVSTTPVGSPLYAMLMNSLGIQLSLEAVAADASTLDSYLAAKRDLAQAASARRMERLLELFAVVAAPLGLAITILQPTLAKQPIVADLSPAQSWLVVSALGAVLIGVWAMLQLFGKHDKK